MSKYGNKKTKRGALTFDSQREAARYDELLALEAGGEITDLRLQPEFTLQEGFTRLDGERVRALRYRADFLYRERVEEGADTRWRLVVEDVKGFRTKEYSIKEKLMAGRCITVREV